MSPLGLSAFADTSSAKPFNILKKPSRNKNQANDPVNLSQFQSFSNHFIISRFPSRWCLLAEVLKPISSSRRVQAETRRSPLCPGASLSEAQPLMVAELES